MTQRLFRMLAVSAVVILAGCKVAVIVVEGGEVQSVSSGTCLSGSVCLHEVSDTNYVETFTAVPDTGWEFVEWNSGGDFFLGCADPASPVCVVSNMGTAGNPLVEAVVASDKVFYLKPIFEPASDPILNYAGSANSASDCIAENGEVVEVSGDPNGTQVCRFDAPACPAGWSHAGGWSTTLNFSQTWIQPAVSSQQIVCNGVTGTFSAIPSATGSLHSGNHSWSNDSSLESQTCAVVTASVQQIEGDCSNPGITQKAATLATNSCFGAGYTSSIEFGDFRASVLSTWVRTSSDIQSIAIRTQIGCF